MTPNDFVAWCIDLTSRFGAWSGFIETTSRPECLAIHRWTTQVDLTTLARPVSLIFVFVKNEITGDGADMPLVTIVREERSSAACRVLATRRFDYRILRGCSD